MVVLMPTTNLERPLQALYISVCRGYQHIVGQWLHEPEATGNLGARPRCDTEMARWAFHDNFQGSVVVSACVLLGVATILEEVMLLWVL